MAANAVRTMEALAGPSVVVASATVRGPRVAALVGLMMVVCVGTVVAEAPRLHLAPALALPLAAMLIGAPRLETSQLHTAPLN